MSRLIFNNLPNARDLLALSRPELAAHLLEHLRAVAGNPLKQQYSHPDNLAISVKEKYPLPFRDKVHKAIFSACEWLRTKGYLIETNNQGFFEITEEGNRVDVAINMIGVHSDPIGANKPDATPESLPRLFISHSWEDKPLVRLLETQLRANRIEVWVDHRSVRAGDNLPDEISNALQWCTTLLLIWSGPSSNSYWVKLEWTNALALRKVIIPCLVDEVPLPPILSHKAYVRLSNIDEGVRQLLYSLRRTDEMSEASTSTQPETTADPGSAREEATAVKNCSPDSSTQVKILSLLSDGALTRSEISRSLVSLYGSETRPAIVSQKLEQLIQEDLVTERRRGDSESRLELTPKGHCAQTSIYTNQAEIETVSSPTKKDLNLRLRELDQQTKRFDEILDKTGKEIERYKALILNLRQQRDKSKQLKISARVQQSKDLLEVTSLAEGIIEEQLKEAVAQLSDLEIIYQETEEKRREHVANVDKIKQEILKKH